MYEKEYEALYEKIPASHCDPSCSKCCRDMIQFSPSEEVRMGGYHWDGQCDHLQAGKCSVYERRAFICRLFGVSELLRCDGCTPERVLSAEETNALVHAYTLLRNRELSQKESQTQRTGA